jgi:hypothetical protein
MKKLLLILLYLAGAVILLGIFNYIFYGDIFTILFNSEPEIVNNPEVIRPDTTLELLINLVDWLAAAEYPQGGYDIIHLNVFLDMVTDESFSFWFGVLDGINVLGILVNDTIYTVHPNLIVYFIIIGVIFLVSQN